MKVRPKRAGFRPIPSLALLLALVLGLAGAALASAEADRCFHLLSSEPKPSLSQLKGCLILQKDLYKRDAAGAGGARYLYRAGRLLTRLHEVTGQPAQLEEAIDAFRRLVNHYPKSALADDAQFQLGEVLLLDKKDPVSAYVEYLKVEINFPQGDMVEPAKQRMRELGRDIQEKKEAPPAPAPAPSKPDRPTPPPASPPQAEAPAETPRPEKPAPEPVTVLGVRQWSTANYTRVVVDLSGPVKFARRPVPRPDPGPDWAATVLVELPGARLKEGVSTDLHPAGRHLKRVRLEQADPRTVRVFVEVRALFDLNVFALDSPSRVVVDLTAPPQTPPPAPSQTPAKPNRVPRGPAKPEKKPSLAVQLGLGVRTVVLDPGHGGQDPGAKTCRAGLWEKDITLEVAKRLAEILRRRHGLKVVLTRQKDETLSLEERNALANTQGADLFISIHVNAAANQRLHGLETYFLNLATDERAVELAARENATTTKSISDLQSILTELVLNTKINESNRLAFQVQKNLAGHLRRYYSPVRSLGVKQAPFYVLMGAQMPSILVEIGFGTNRIECRRLQNDKYLARTAEGLARGVTAYIKQTKGRL